MRIVLEITLFDSCDLSLQPTSDYWRVELNTLIKVVQIRRGSETPPFPVPYQLRKRKCIFYFFRNSCLDAAKVSKYICEKTFFLNILKIVRNRCFFIEFLNKNENIF